MNIAAGIAHALKVDELSVKPTTGSEAQAQLGRMTARLVARYRLTAVPGRTEELIRPGSPRGVSLGYGCRTIRVRTMLGREWTGWHDFQIGDGWQAALDELVDEWLGQPTPHIENQVDPRTDPLTNMALIRRPIRDIPQA